LTADADSAAVAPARPHMTLPTIGVLLAVTVVWGVNFAVVKGAGHAADRLRRHASRSSGHAAARLRWLPAISRSRLPA
jgi:hypothetical protein